MGFLRSISNSATGSAKNISAGTYINHSQNDSSGVLCVLDVSITGLAFTCLDVTTFKVGDEFSIEFTLDDEHLTAIKKGVIVRSVRQRSVGCKYVKEEEVFGSPLGHYVKQIL